MMNPTRAMTDNNQTPGGAIMISEPPPDIVQPVVVVSQSLGSGVTRAPDGDGGDFHISAPPPDIIQPVAVVVQGRPGEAAAQSSALAGEDGSDACLFLKESDYSEEVGEADEPERVEAGTAAGELGLEEMFRIIREVAFADSGEERHAAVVTERDYATSADAATRGRQFGLCFGLVLFTQESGRLGSVLRLMQRRDADAFADIFGPDAAALVGTTTAPTPAERLAPVGGEYLWSERWVERFRRAGGVPAFQAAQNEEAVEGLFRPMLKVAFELGLNTDRGLAMAYDRVVTCGLGGGLRRVVQAAGPLRTAAQRAHALGMLGAASLAQFQASTGWVAPTGRFGPETHAALVGALRRQGTATLPSAEQMAWGLFAQATGRARLRLRRLLDSNSFADSAYSLGS
jgi:hypothetical protein